MRGSVLLMPLLLMFGCGSGTHPRDEWAEKRLWNGDEEVDDLDSGLLYGHWVSVDPDFGGAVHLHIKSHRIRFDYSRIKGVPDETYRFIINSRRSPKAIRFLERLEPLPRISLPWNHTSYNRRYSIDGDRLAIWTYWAEIGEQPKYHFKRVWP